MAQKILLALGVVCFGISAACDRPAVPVSPTVATTGGSTDAGPGGSTLKVPAPVLLAPVKGAQPAPGSPIVVTLQNVAGSYASFPVTYEIQILNGNSVVTTQKVSASTGATTSATITGTVIADTNLTWQARAVYGAGLGPWSDVASFRSPLQAFLGGPTGKEIFDPLTGNFTVGQQVGGRFVAGGWQALSLNDGINYDLPSTCSNCRLEFDVTNFGRAEGLSVEKDVKWLTMGDAFAFGDFGTFRDHPWKMHLEQRADFDGTGMKLIWRNGCGNCGDGEPGDHTGKLNTTDLNFKSSNSYHFVFDWTPSHISVQVNGEEYFSDGWSHPYAPPAHRVSLGCYPRSETMIGAIWSNVRMVAR
jgi:hypothetical protein